MEFGVVGCSFADHPWRDFVQALVQLGVEALELDTRPNAHCSTWSPDLDPSTIVEDLKDKSLRVGGVMVNVDLVQPEEAALAGEVERVIENMELSFRYRSEIVRLSPQRPKPGMSRAETLDCIRKACIGFLGHAEENAMLVCLQPEAELLRDAGTIRELLEACESYNLKVSLDPLVLLRALKDPEAVRTVAMALLPDTAHVVLRDGKLNRATGMVTETAVGQGDCPVDMIVSELTAANFYRPYYVAYDGSGDAFDAVQEGIRYFRDLPSRILGEMGLL
ncbi:MAG: sugar phosphate isomerase/epimerase [Armatimonadetes bacterium]|nr:sugar phosphate isomerase/epimerase [Armatimonadota bacterium]